MTPRTQFRWEVWVFRLWIRLLGTRLTERFENDLVDETTLIDRFGAPL